MPPPSLRPWQLQERLRRRGSEPDPRMSLANERTFLAWVRTALGLLAAGVAADSLLPPSGVRPWLSGAVVLLGALVASRASIRWWHVELALREQRPLPVTRLTTVLAYGVALAGVVVVVLVAVS